MKMGIALPGRPVSQTIAPLQTQPFSARIRRNVLTDSPASGSVVSLKVKSAKRIAIAQTDNFVSKASVSNRATALTIQTAQSDNFATIANAFHQPARRMTIATSLASSEKQRAATANAWSLNAATILIARQTRHVFSISAKTFWNAAQMRTALKTSSASTTSAVSSAESAVQTEIADRSKSASKGSVVPTIDSAKTIAIALQVLSAKTGSANRHANAKRHETARTESSA